MVGEQPFKEVVVDFVPSGGDPPSPHLAFLLRSSLVAELQHLQVDDEGAWELMLVQGPDEELDTFQRLLDLAPAGRFLELRTVDRARGRLLYYCKWPRPQGETAVSVEHLVHDFLGGETAVRKSIREGRIRYTLVTDHDQGIPGLLAAARAAVGERYRVEVERIGPFLARPRLDARRLADIQLLRLALRRGYYERPRRVGVIALAKESGISKSAVAKRLAAMERRLLEEWVRELGEPPEPALEVGGSERSEGRAPAS